MVVENTDLLAALTKKTLFVLTEEWEDYINE